jgi:hypothetical protein
MTEPVPPAEPRTLFLFENLPDDREGEPFAGTVRPFIGPEGANDGMRLPLHHSLI